MKTTFSEETTLNKKINLLLKNLEISKSTKEKKKIKLEGEKIVKKIKTKCKLSKKKIFYH